MDVLVTDHGEVKLSKKTLAYLDSLGDWREILRNKRRRGKAAQQVRAKVSAVEKAAMTLSAIEWHAGGVLSEL